MTHPAFETVPARDGFPLATRVFAADPGKSPATVAVVASAMGVKQDFYAPFAAWLASEGVPTLTFDYRGMGASRPEGLGLDGFSATIEDWATLDCAAILDHVAERYPGARVVWLGHSVGAQILGLIPNRERVHAMLSIAAGSGYWRYNAKPLRYYVLSMWLFIMPVAVRMAGYFPGRKLKMVGDLPRGVAEQWRKWCLSADYLGAEGDRVRPGLADVSIPITALSMQDDEMMTLRGTQALFGLYPNAQVEVRRLRPRELGLRGIGHFGFFRSSMKEPLWPMVTEWIEAHARA